MPFQGGRGSDYVCGAADCCEPLPRERRSALVAQLGSDRFLVGDGATHTSQSGGPLFLRVNDCDEGLHDNGGSLSVDVALVDR